MNAAGYQFGTIGNHEFNAAPDWLPQLLDQGRRIRWCWPMPRCKATGAPLVPPYRIEKVGGVRVALFGLHHEVHAGISGRPRSRPDCRRVPDRPRRWCPSCGPRPTSSSCCRTAGRRGREARRRGARHRRHRRRPLAHADSRRRVRVARRRSAGRRRRWHDHRAGAPVGRRTRPARPAVRARPRTARGRVVAVPVAPAADHAGHAR